MPSFLSTLSAVAALLTTALAQSSCNPTKGTCTPDPALGKAVFYDFTQGSSNDWSLSTGSFPTFDTNGAEFTIAKHLDSPTLSSQWYMMFGHYDVVVKTAPGQGVISSAVLMSDTHDEVDLEWLGAQDTNVQANYFGQGNEGSEINLAVTKPQEEYHTYSIDWTANALTWIIDGKVLRTITPANGHFPQSPMQLKIGTWPGGDPSEAPGTIAWAGGPIDYSKGPYTMTVKNVTVYDYSTGSSYAYTDTTGLMGSIKSNGGTIKQSGNINTMVVSTASMNGFSTSTSIAPTSTVVPTSTVAPTSTVVPTTTPSAPAATHTTTSTTIPAGAGISSTLSTSVQIATPSTHSSAPSTAAQPSTTSQPSTPTSTPTPSLPSASSAEVPTPSTLTTFTTVLETTIPTPSAGNPSPTPITVTTLATVVETVLPTPTPILPTSVPACESSSAVLSLPPTPTTFTTLQIKPSPPSNPGHGGGSGSGTGTGTGTGTSDLPPAVQSEIAAASAKNPAWGRFLTVIWEWIERMKRGGYWGRGRRGRAQW